MQRMFILLLLLIFTKSISAEEWDNTKKTMFTVSNIAIVADWATTTNLTGRHSEGYYEKNKILGRTPNKESVHMYFLARLVSNYLLAKHLSEEWDIVYLGLTTVVHGSAAINNHSIGLRYKF